MTMKHQQTDSWFMVAGKAIQPFNGEWDPNVKQPSWSIGMTHFRYKSGVIGMCSIEWFEAQAQPIRNAGPQIGNQ